MRFNLNDQVGLKLNQFGKNVYHEHMQRWPTVDREGYTWMQGHDMIVIFGKRSLNGNEPFDMEIKIEKGDLKE